MKKIILIFSIVSFVFIVGCHVGGHAPYINDENDDENNNQQNIILESSLTENID